jgi:hypothetical protein
MSLTEYPEVIQGTDEWHDQRRGMVTASVVGQLLSVSTLGADGYDCPDCGAAAGDPCQSKRAGAGPIKTMHPARVAYAAEHADTAPLVIETAHGDTARGLTRLLVAERITGHTEPTYMSDDMLRGWEDEPRAIEKYAEHYAPVTTTGFMVRDDWGFQIGYSPDGLVHDDGLVEVKSRRQKKQLQTILSGEVPAENLAQIQCGLLVSGREWCDYISYCGGMPLWVKRVYPDQAWFDAIVAAVAAFEADAERMTATYRSAVEGLPMTERVIEMEMTL